MNHHQAIKNYEEQPIPTIMNGAICVNNSGKHGFKHNYAIHDRIIILSKSINKSNSDITDLSNKHRVVLVDDSHIRGYGGNLTSVLSKIYEIYSVVKPGSNSCELKVSAKEEINCLSYNDIVVICYGSNDYELNEYSMTLRNISNFIQTNNHTNIVVLNVPFRYDLLNLNLVNNNISILNRKIKKLTKKAFPHANVIEIDNNRKLFTNHRLHRNKLGNGWLFICWHLLFSHFLNREFSLRLLWIGIMNCKIMAILSVKK
jgi:hypothetical protein